MSHPVWFAFGLHLHQPVGNFDAVFEQHLAEVYRPLLSTLRDGEALPVTLHVSGPLLEWLDARAPAFLDLLAGLAADRQVELLASGHDEPILAVLPREDRLEQIGRMRETLARRFGVRATGLWLTERVWEPDLAGDLADAGIEYVLVDDRHFLVAGFERDALHLPYRTEAGGRAVTLFPIDERLRYLVPFREPEEFAAYIHRLRDGGHRLAVLADDGEKFGGWPGTRTWVYERGWMDRFLDTLRRLRGEGTLRMVTFREALDSLPSGGLAYLPSASYRELEAWALPPARAAALTSLEGVVGGHGDGVEGTLLRGSHWRHFLVKYPEANLMHKKMLALSRLCRERGDPPAARRAVGRAQCNDAYWHGVFGGLYLPHLRAAVWRNLAEAERVLRAGEALAWEVTDLDADGHAELWLHSDRVSVLLSPARGGRIEELTNLTTGVNHADVLTRRREAYHQVRPAPAPASEPVPGAPSIHELEHTMALDALPPVDRERRALLAEYLAGPSVGAATLAAGDAPLLRSWAAEAFEASVAPAGEAVTVALTGPGLRKHLRVEPGGTIAVRYAWDPPAAGEAWFVVELSASAELGVEAPGHDRDAYPIETVAKSERGFDRTVQGQATVLRWPAAAGSATLTLAPPDAG